MRWRSCGSRPEFLRKVVRRGRAAYGLCRRSRSPAGEIVVIPRRGYFQLTFPCMGERGRRRQRPIAPSIRCGRGRSTKSRNRAEASGTRRSKQERQTRCPDGNHGRAACSSASSPRVRHVGAHRRGPPALGPFAAAEAADAPSAPAAAVVLAASGSAPARDPARGRPVAAPGRAGSGGVRSPTGPRRRARPSGCGLPPRRRARRRGRRPPLARPPRRRDDLPLGGVLRGRGVLGRGRERGREGAPVAGLHRRCDGGRDDLLARRLGAAGEHRRRLRGRGRAPGAGRQPAAPSAPAQADAAPPRPPRLRRRSSRRSRCSRRRRRRPTPAASTPVQVVHVRESAPKAVSTHSAAKRPHRDGSGRASACRS